MSELTGAQREAIRRLMAEYGVDAVHVERDEPHDTHLFVTCHVPGASRHPERVIDADGSYEE